MASKDNPNIYNIDFAILDERKYRGAVRKLPKTVEEVPLESEPASLIAEPIGRVALVADTIEGVIPTNEQAEVIVDIPKPIEAPPPYIPPEILELAQSTVDGLLESSTKPVVPIAMLVDRAFGQRVPRQSYRHFKNALRQDSRLEYLGSGDFKIVEAESPIIYWPDENPNVDKDHIAELSESVVEAMEAATWNPHIHFSFLNVLGIVKGLGEYLGADEQNELFAAVASNPKVTALEGGTFKVFKEFPTSPDVSEDGLRMLSLDFDKEPRVNDKPMSSKQIGKTMNKINSSVAVRIAADLGKRKANPRRRGKRKGTTKKLQGRVHNKAQRQQTFITRVMESNPRAATMNNVTKVEEPDVDSIEVDSLLETPQEAKAPVVASAELTKPAEAVRTFEPAKVSDYEAFAKKHFGDFSDIPLLIQAFTHRSYLNENRSEISVSDHNERLEYLGDAVLYMTVSEYLYRNCPESEGILTQWRTALVRNSVIGAVAEQEGFEALLRLSRGEKKGKERARRQILANCYEAVLGAVYLTKGAPEAQKFIENTLLPTLEKILQEESWRDPKSRLQEMFQEDGGSTPEYRLVHQEGPDHDKLFVVGVYVDGKLLAEGAGVSQKDAQVTAAMNALDSVLIYKENP